MIEQNWGPEPLPVQRDSRPSERWTGAGRQPTAPQEAPPPAKEKKPAGIGQVLAVQCIACVVAVLLVLLLRTAGGTAYAQLRQSFQDSLMRNDLLATWAKLWDGDPAEAVSDELESRNDQAAAMEGDESVPEKNNRTEDEPDSPRGSSSDGQPDSSSEESSQTPAASGTAAGGRLPPEGALAVRLQVNRTAVPPLRSGTLTSGYGYRESPRGGAEQFHWGVDIAAPAGTPIAAMFFGTVTAAGESPSFGNYLRIHHGDGVEVLYAHCQQLLVAAGTVVRAGETVALVGATGEATGNHLHVQVSCEGEVYHPGGIIPLEYYVRKT